ncbi:MAG: formyltetrahydrofolate deformylase [Cytophagales bacterium]|nr:formyltetrahydrofolate deformylase [Bernardetiaceae bacterium]MDW8211012.1 formyltetrahydrofolate deformylase [Cytophagales bacterium]
METKSVNHFQTHVLLIDCPDQQGLVHKITGVLYHHHLNILRNDEFVERTTGHFYMRTEFVGPLNAEKVIYGLRGILPDEANIRLESVHPKRVVILATKEHHCLSDLLVRNMYKDLLMDVKAVIANREHLRPLVEKFDIPFIYLPHEGLSRQEHESELLKAIAPFHPEFLVLAKYMRILTADFISHFPNRIINIHHSFLPAFVGANPYKQAYERGVKIIGATAHFVNENLDEGPIIMQDVIHVDHSKTAADMARAGRDVEKIVLARALKLVFEDRVFVRNNKTVIFE